MRDEGEVFKSVTEVSYKNLKKVTVFGDYRDDLLYDAMQHTLDIVKNEEVGTEALSVYFLSDMKLADECISDAADGTVRKFRMDSPYVSIHNHPSGKTFSISDTNIFVTDSNCKIMMIVGNDGNVYMLKKTTMYNATDYYEHCMKSLLGFEIYNSMDDFLKEGEKYGVTYYKGTN